MGSFSELKRGAASAIGSSIKLAEKLDFKTAAENIKRIEKEFNSKEMFVVVAGEARRGKSSLLNALLNETEPLFPVDINVTTNVVTVVRYGKETKIEAVIDEGKGAIKREQVDRDSIADYVSEIGNPHNYKNISLLEIAIPNDYLKGGVVFVDTPGVGSLNPLHAETTYSFLPNADMLLFVTDTLSGMTETELDFLKRGYEYCKNIVFPVTKKDQNQSYQVIVDDNREKIHNALGIPIDEINVIPVSNTAKQRYLKTEKKTMYENSNYEELERAIWTTIARTRSDVFITPFVLETREEIFKLSENVATQYQLLNSDKSKTEELIAAMKANSETLKTLKDDGARWRSELGTACTVLNNNISADLQQLSTEANDILNTSSASLGTKICNENEYTRLILEINRNLRRGILEIREKIENEINGIAVKVGTSLKLDLSVNEQALNKIDFEPNNDLEIKFPERSFVDKITYKGREISSNSISFGAIGGATAMIVGGAIGFVIGGPAGAIGTGKMAMALGSAIGGAIGSAKGAADALHGHTNADVPFVTKTITQYIASSISDVRTTMVNVMTVVRQELMDSFNMKLSVRIEETNENIKQIQQNVKLQKTEVPKKLAALKQQSDVLSTQLKRLDAVLKSDSHSADLEEEDGNPDNGSSEKTKQGDDVSYSFL